MQAQAQRQYERIEPVRYTRRPRSNRRPLIQSWLNNPMVCVVLLVAVLCMLASTYVSAYAAFTEKGRSRALLISNLYRLKKENEKLRLTVDQLKQPDLIEGYALANQMKQCQATAYVVPVGNPRVARSTVALGVR